MTEHNPANDITVTVGELYDLACLTLPDDRSKLLDLLLRHAPIRPELTNLDRAIAIVNRINDVRGVQRELKAAFARSELDGGVKAAPDHPVFLDAEDELRSLHEQLMLLV